jgi:hypothetical protein
MAIHWSTEGRTAAKRWNWQPQIRWAARHRATKLEMKERALKQTNSRVMVASAVPQ